MMSLPQKSELSVLKIPQKDAFCRILKLRYYNLSAQGCKMMRFLLENDKLLRNRGMVFSYGTTVLPNCIWCECTYNSLCMYLVYSRTPCVFGVQTFYSVCIWCTAILHVYLVYRRFILCVFGVQPYSVCIWCTDILLCVYLVYSRTPCVFGVQTFYSVCIWCTAVLNVYLVYRHFILCVYGVQPYSVCIWCTDILFCVYMVYSRTTWVFAVSL